MYISDNAQSRNNTLELIDKLISLGYHKGSRFTANDIGCYGATISKEATNYYRSCSICCPIAVVGEKECWFDVDEDTRKKGTVHIYCLQVEPMEWKADFARGMQDYNKEKMAEKTRRIAELTRQIAILTDEIAKVQGQ